MNIFWQLFGLAIITLSFDFCATFQVDPAGPESNYRHDQRIVALVNEEKFGYDTLLLSTCQKKYPASATLDLSRPGVEPLPLNSILNRNPSCLNLKKQNFYRRLSMITYQKIENLEYLNLAEIPFNIQFFIRSTFHSNIKTLILDGARDVHGMFIGESEAFRTLKLDYPKLEILSLQKIKRVNNEVNDFSFLQLNSTILTHLFLSDNDMREINDETLKTFPSTLTHLYLERCRLNSYLSSNSYTKALTLLSLDGNNFSCANGDCLNFDNHPNLQYLSLTNCKIINIVEDVFFYNPKLKYLDLSDNNIQQISPRVFLRTPTLEALNLNHNNLEEMLNFETLRNLNKLFIMDNAISFFDTTTFKKITFLKLIAFSSRKGIRFYRVVTTYTNETGTYDISDNPRYHFLKYLPPNMSLIVKP